MGFEHPKLPLSVRHYFLDRFSKNPRISNFMKINLIAAQLFYETRQRDGRTDDESDMTKLTVIFRNFALNAEKAFGCFVWIPAQAKIIILSGFCNRDGLCLLRGTRLILKCNSCCMWYPQRYSCHPITWPLYMQTSSLLQI